MTSLLLTLAVPLHATRDQHNNHNHNNQHDNINKNWRQPDLVQLHYRHRGAASKPDLLVSGEAGRKRRIRSDRPRQGGHRGKRRHSATGGEEVGIKRAAPAFPGHLGQQQHGQLGQQSVAAYGGWGAGAGVESNNETRIVLKWSRVFRYLRQNIIQFCH